MRCEGFIGDVHRSVRLNRPEDELMSSKLSSDVWPLMNDRGGGYDL